MVFRSTPCCQQPRPNSPCKTLGRTSYHLKGVGLQCRHTYGTIQRTNTGLARTVANGTKLGRKKVTNDTMTAKIVELRNTKKSIRAIASEVGVSTATVQRELKKVA